MRGRGRLRPHPSQTFSLREFPGWVNRSRCARRTGDFVDLRGRKPNGKKQFRTECAGLTHILQPGILEVGLSGSSSVVEHRLAKARVASSSLVSRSIPHFSGAFEPGEGWNETIRNP